MVDIGRDDLDFPRSPGGLPGDRGGPRQDGVDEGGARLGAVQRDPIAHGGQVRPRGRGKSDAPLDFRVDFAGNCRNDVARPVFGHHASDLEILVAVR